MPKPFNTYNKRSKASQLARIHKVKIALRKTSLGALITWPYPILFLAKN